MAHSHAEADSPRLGCQGAPSQPGMRLRGAKKSPATRLGACAACPDVWPTRPRASACLPRTASALSQCRRHLWPSRRRRRSDLCARPARTSRALSALRTGSVSALGQAQRPAVTPLPRTGRRERSDERPPSTVRKVDDHLKVRLAWKFIITKVVDFYR
jgi:hypothetical protein